MVRIHGCLSKVIQITCSIIAGCVNSSHLARIFLYHLMEDLAYRLPANTGSNPCPTPELYQYVDDLVNRVGGTFNQVLRALVHVGVHLASGIQDLGGALSPKSCIVASSPPLARALQKALAAEGFRLQITTQARDVGIANTAGARRGTAVAKQRFVDSQRRHLNCVSLAKLNKRAS